MGGGPRECCAASGAKSESSFIMTTWYLAEYTADRMLLVGSPGGHLVGVGVRVGEGGGTYAVYLLTLLMLMHVQCKQYRMYTWTTVQRD